MEFNKSSVIITGASRGIGSVIARTFAAKTDRPLFLLARDKEGLEKTRLSCHETGGKFVEWTSCDAGDKAKVRALSLPDNFPPPGILVNNAGSFLLKPLERTTAEDLEGQLRTNLLTAFNVTTRFLPEMMELERGLIVNICSIASLQGFADSGAYTASKHGLLGYTRSLRKALMDKNIAVTAINLGQTQSTSWEGSDMDPGLLIDPADIADLILTLSQMSPRTVVEEVILSPQHGQVPPK